MDWTADRGQFGLTVGLLGGDLGRNQSEDALHARLPRHDIVHVKHARQLLFQQQISENLQQHQHQLGTYIPLYGELQGTATSPASWQGAIASFP